VNKAFCSFVARLNQGLQRQVPSLKVPNFRYALPILNILIDEGYVRYYTISNKLLIVYFRTVGGKPILSKITAKSRPSKRSFIRYKQLGKRNFIRLYLIDGCIVTSNEVKSQRRGGVFLMEFL
jgi:ribosomal protein S8